MTVPLPTALPVTSGWTVADWLDRSYSSTPAGSGGVVTVTVPPLPQNERWQVTHALSACTSTTATQMRLYLDTVAAAALRDGTNTGNFDVADWPQGLWIPPGRSLVAQWVGCSAGAVATLNLQATVLRTAS